MINKKSTPIQRFKKFCIFCKKDAPDLNYKNVDLLMHYISAKGKIISSRISRNCAKHQRRLAREIKRARSLSLIPYLR